jgi:hypothetical protein
MIETIVPIGKVKRYGYDLYTVRIHHDTHGGILLRKDKELMKWMAWIPKHPDEYND